MHLGRSEDEVIVTKIHQLLVLPQLYNYTVVLL